MSAVDKLSRYNDLFSDDKEKAEAFDELAKVFYAGNFGSMTKANIETLMFSIYLEQILKRDEDDFAQYSDYELAKELGIPQSRILNLKVRKQLQYPREFDWQKSLAKISKKARYDDGKIKLQIPDINLYYAIRNEVELQGGYVEMTLTPKLLQIPLKFFMDFILALLEDEERDKVRKILREEFRKENKEAEYIETLPFGKQIKKCGSDVLQNVLSAKLSNVSVNAILKNVIQLL